jgi:hypothetical protein
MICSDSKIRIHFPEIITHRSTIMKRHFEDWFSSYRGAGVIGTVVAVGVLVSLGSLFLLAFQEDDGKGKSISRIILEQGKEIDQLRDAVHSVNMRVIELQRNYDISRECDLLQRRLSDQTIRCQEQEMALQEAEREMESLIQEKKQYTDAYRIFIRKNEIGKSYPELVTKSGRTYRRVVVKKIDDLRVGITHETGGGTVKWNDLPDDMYQRLLFHEDLALAQSKKESDAASHFASQFEDSEIKSSIMALEESMADAKSAFESKRALASQSSAKISSAQDQILRLQKLIQSEVQKEGLRQTPRYRSQIMTLEKSIDEERRRLADFSIAEQKHRQEIEEMMRRAELLRKKRE